jgi:SHS2 domain-containing protein
MAARWREIEHTGDLAIEIAADTRAELFAEALVALSRLMVDPDLIRMTHDRLLPVGDGDDAEALRDLLAAALNVFLGDGFIWLEAEVRETDSGSTIARLVGEKFDPARHQLLEEMKAVTYHRLNVEPVGDGWRAMVVFDA